jgi:error-prone DNA polymerase
VQERHRQALMTSQLVVIKGTVEARNGVVHVIASALENHSAQLSTLTVASRDFH